LDLEWTLETFLWAYIYIFKAIPIFFKSKQFTFKSFLVCLPIKGSVKN
jgi:hypothetical protein